MELLGFHHTPQLTLGAGNQPTLLPVVILGGTVYGEVVRIEEGQILVSIEGDGGHLTLHPDAIARVTPR
jgi:ribosomal protein L16/L10AE